MRIPFLPEYAFSKPGMLLLLVALPLLFLLRGRIGRAPAIVFSSLPFLKSIGVPVRSRCGLPTAAVATALALISGILALARPQELNSKEQFTASGVEIFLAIDVSFSMSIVDFRLDNFRVNRLDAAKHVISEFVTGRTTDRIGIVIFSGRPHALGPLTLDHEWLLRTIRDEIHFDHPIEPATAIGTAIASCANQLTNREADRKAKSQIVVLLTDGHQTVPGLEPAEAALLASTLGIKVYPIAIGTPGEHFVPRIRSKMSQTFDLETLQEVAAITGGKSYLANDTETLRQIFAEIDQLEKSEIDQHTTIETRELYQWFAGAALVFLLAGLALEHSVLRYSP